METPGEGGLTETQINILNRGQEDGRAKDQNKKPVADKTMADTGQDTADR